MANLNPPRAPASASALANYIALVGYPGLSFSVGSDDVFQAVGHVFKNGDL
jgi:hypothetical protein